MAVGGIVASDFAVEWVIEAWVSYLQEACTLGLFQTAVTTTPATVIGDLTESTYPGYGRIDITSALGAAAGVIPGEWQSVVPTQTFSCTGGSGQTVYGFFVIDSAGALWFSQTFSTPLLMVAGGSFGLQLNLQEWALAIVS
jgi:hypothetical protein